MRLYRGHKKRIGPPVLITRVQMKSSDTLLLLLLRSHSYWWPTSKRWVGGNSNENGNTIEYRIVNRSTIENVGLNLTCSVLIWSQYRTLSLAFISLSVVIYGVEYVVNLAIRNTNKIMSWTKSPMRRLHSLFFANSCASIIATHRYCNSVVFIQVYK